MNRDSSLEISTIFHGNNSRISTKFVCILFAQYCISIVTRPVTQSTLDRYVDRLSTDVFMEIPLMSVEVSTVTISGAYRSTTGGILVNSRRNVGRVSFDSRASLPIGTYICMLSKAPVSRHISRHIGRLSTVTIGQVSVDISAEYRPTYRPIVDRYLANSVGVQDGLDRPHDSYGSWLLYICHFLLGISTIFVASL